MIKNLKILSLFSLIIFVQTNIIFSGEKEQTSKKERTEQLKKEIWFWRLAYPITIIAGLFTIHKLNSKINGLTSDKTNLAKDLDDCLYPYTPILLSGNHQYKIS